MIATFQKSSKRALAANLDPNLFSGHSLRAGFITTAAVNDVSLGNHGTVASSLR